MEEIEPVHVWVDVTGAWGLSARPGILIARDWVDGPGKPHWVGWVIEAERISGGGRSSVTVRQGWHNASHIRVASTDPPPRTVKHRPVNEGRGN